MGRALASVVRAHARRALAPAALRAAVRGMDDGWREAESALATELGTSPRRAQALVRAFGAVARAHGGDEARGRAARLAGSHAAYLGRHAAALPHYAQAERLLDGAARDGARLGRAAALLRLGRFDDAVAACRDVRRDARRRRDTLLAAGADLNEAVALHEGGAPAKSLALYARAERAFAAAGNAQFAATAAQNRANALVLLDRYAEAAPLYAAARTLFEGLGLAHEAARCLYNIGALHAATDRLGDADETLRDAERALRRAGDAKQAALAALDRAEVLLRGGLAAEAYDLVVRARRAMGTGVPPVERERARLVAARALVDLGRADAARRLLRAPVAGRLARLDAERLEILGRAEALAGRAAHAAATLRRAATAQARAGHPVGASRCRTAAAACLLAAGDARGARRETTAAMQLARGLDLPALRHAHAAVRFLVADATGERDAASLALDEALAELERVRAGLGPDALRAAVLRGREAWFARAVRHVLDGPGGADAALALLERWRARALRDLLAGATRLASGEATLDALRDRLAQLERRVEGVVGPELVRARPGEAPEAAARALAGAERRLRDAARLAADGTAPALDLRALRRRLAPGELALALFADDAGALHFAVDRAGVHVVRSATTAAHVAELVDALRFQLGQFELGADFRTRHAARLGRRVGELLAQLAAVTLEPLAERIRAARRIVIVPHGAWHHAPLAALPFDGAPLVAHADVVLAPALAAARVRTPVARGRDVVVAVADAAAPQISTEARRVAELLDAELLEGDAARLDALPRRAPRSLHVAAHGRYRADVPALCGVRLADGWLRAVEFPRLALGGSTVVLSGCETGLSAVDAGDEVHGLVRGVLASGARELVASLWRVDDAATAELMARLHAARRDGADAATALARTQRALAADGVAPWFWAGFQAWQPALS